MPEGIKAPDLSFCAERDVGVMWLPLVSERAEAADSSSGAEWGVDTGLFVRVPVSAFTEEPAEGYLASAAVPAVACAAMGACVKVSDIPAVAEFFRFC